MSMSVVEVCAVGKAAGAFEYSRAVWKLRAVHGKAHNQLCVFAPADKTLLR